MSDIQLTARYGMVAGGALVLAALVAGCAGSPKGATPGCDAAFETYEVAHAAGPGDVAVEAEFATLDACSSLEDWKRAAMARQGPGELYPEMGESTFDGMLNVMCGQVDFAPAGCQSEAD